MSKFEKKLKDELNSQTPDLKQSIKEKANFKTKKQIPWQRVAMPIVAVMVLMVAIITPIMVINPNNSETDNYILSLSVNPSVEIAYGQDDIVTAVKPLNKDGVVILQSTVLKSLKGKNVKDATNLVIEEMNLLGYFDVNDEIRITVKNNKGDFEKNEFNEIKQGIESKLVLLGLTKSINKMTEEELDNLEDLIENNEEAYYNEFKEEIKEYLTKKQPIVDKALQDIFAEMVKDNSTLTNYKDIKAIKVIYKDNETQVTNTNIINIVNEYQSKYDDFDNIETFDDLYEVYDDLLDELEEISSALKEIEKGKIPDDIDDIIEDLIELAISNK